MKTVHYADILIIGIRITGSYNENIWDVKIHTIAQAYCVIGCIMDQVFYLNLLCLEDIITIVWEKFGMTKIFIGTRV